MISLARLGWVDDSDPLHLVEVGRALVAEERDARTGVLVPAVHHDLVARGEVVSLNGPVPSAPLAP